MAHSLTPVPQDIANAVEDYVRSELRDCARYWLRVGDWWRSGGNPGLWQEVPNA